MNNPMTPAWHGRNNLRGRSPPYEQTGNRALVTAVPLPSDEEFQQALQYLVRLMARTAAAEHCQGVVPDSSCVQSPQVEEHQKWPSP